ncbi:hypothetical protein G7Y79_00025g057110 [Physcia stellaris]|nr:hypothetical protein G7Y79_00025g057110 [Physcia stellaris]
MAFETSATISGQGLPTPTSTPHQTSFSRQTYDHNSSPPPSLPPLSFENESNAVKDADDKENISPLDPRRFTPNLHASLVSQILSLQRDVESKSNTVNNLEEFLHITQEENIKLTANLSSERKEGRAIRKQMHMLESTTLTALGDLAKERDGALDDLTDTRNRLEACKSKVRRQDEDAQKTQEQWDKEKQNWDTEKRSMETKIQLVEGRLKLVLAEVAAAQVMEEQIPRSSVEYDEGMRQTWYTKESDCTSTRSNSVKDRARFSGLSIKSHGSPNFRASTLNGLHGFGMGHLNGMSLAEELEFTPDEADGEDGDVSEEITSPNALPEEVQFHRRKASVQSFSQDQKAWKLLGLLKENNEQPTTEEDVPEKVPALSLEDDRSNEKPSLEKALPDIPEGGIHARYTGPSTQCSPLSSPKMVPRQDPTVSEKPTEQTNSTEPTANQRRKRVSAPLSEQLLPAKPNPQPLSGMVSSSCQTVERPPSPPLTPMFTIEPLPAPDKVTQMTSSSTQTNEEQKAALVTADTRRYSSSMSIPVIEIHPPGSRPPSSHNSVVLPPRTRNAGCQASIQLPVSTCSVSIQTEKTENSTRPFELPPRSLSTTGSQSSLGKSGLPRIEERPQPTPRRSSRKNIHRPPSLRPLIKPSYAAPVDAYPGSNDNGPLNNKQLTGPRRPLRSGSLFAGFDSAHGEDVLDLKSLDLSSDDDFATAAPIRKTLSKVQNSWKLVPQSRNANPMGLGSAGNSTENLDFYEASDPWLASLVPESDSDSRKIQGKPEPRLPGPSSTAKKFNVRPRTQRERTINNLHARNRSPSARDLPNDDRTKAAPPPFPVPTRSSSRKIPISFSEGAQSPSPQSTAFFSNARKPEIKRPSSKNPLRKVRSAAAVARFTRSGQPRTPQSSAASTAPSETSQLPRMPRNSITSRQPSETQVRQTTHVLPQASLEGDATIETPGQQTSVVDAIAQTMVGEWMWKYVRRRKSFGVTDDIDFDEKGLGNGIRHKRWVWLAPYERAVLWSSKQPTSGPALLGKNGRKLNIKSVLDVKDDAPMPKNADVNACFGRSILILTPQRALKFTATTRERHYVWLTALSFLSHSPLGMDDLATLPPMPQQEDQRPPSQPTGGLRRAPIRDSIRVAKSKPRPSLNGHAYSSPITTLQHQPLEAPRAPALEDDPDSDAAEPPAIPRTTSQTRTHTHVRKRSNTGPRPGPPSSFHSFPANTSTRSLRSSSASNDVYSAFSPHSPSISTGTMNHHLSQLSHDPMPAVRNNFFDAVGSGTVRMEAFVEEPKRQGRKQVPPLGNSWARDAREANMKKDLRYWGVGSVDQARGKKRGVGMESALKGVEDPFLGF